MGTGNWQLGKYTLHISYYDVYVKRQAVKLDVLILPDSDSRKRFKN
jgi:hypothetical protein